jgi:thioredoxin 1
MKRFYSIMLMALIVASCQGTGNNAGQQGIRKSIPVQEFAQKLAATNVQLIDVRTPGEYEQDHLKNAVNIDINSDDFEQRIGKLNKKMPVLVYCLSGGRSSSAASKMQDMGFTEVYNMDGGIMKWQSAGKPVGQGAAVASKAGITIDELNKMTAASKYVLVDYNAPWCEPCKKMMPYIEALAVQKKDKLSLVTIDADDNKELLRQKNIDGIPYLELYENGKLVWKHSGFIEEADLLKETRL